MTSNILLIPPYYDDSDDNYWTGDATTRIASGYYSQETSDPFGVNANYTAKSVARRLYFYDYGNTRYNIDFIGAKNPIGFKAVTVTIWIDGDGHPTREEMIALKNLEQSDGLEAALAAAAVYDKPLLTSITDIGADDPRIPQPLTGDTWRTWSRVIKGESTLPKDVIIRSVNENPDWKNYYPGKGHIYADHYTEFIEVLNARGNWVAALRPYNTWRKATRYKFSFQVDPTQIETDQDIPPLYENL